MDPYQAAAAGASALVAAVKSQWVNKRERGSAGLIRLMCWLCQRRYRWLVEILLYPITAYFFLTAGASRRASRHFFQSATGRFLWIDHYRQLLCFARSLVDRISMLMGEAAHFKARPHGREQLVELNNKGIGFILLGSHLGNFEAAKLLLKDRVDIEVHIVAYFGGSRKIRAALDAINPDFTKNVIDPTHQDAVFQMRDVIESGGVLAILGDRTDIGEKQISVEFMGKQATLPAGPYFLAAILKCPVYCFFGLRVGNGLYDSYLVKLADRIKLSRGHREAQAKPYAQAYADLLAEKAIRYPYNWFNFFEFWNDPAAE